MPEVTANFGRQFKMKFMMETLNFCIEPGKGGNHVEVS